MLATFVERSMFVCTGLGSSCQIWCTQLYLLPTAAAVYNAAYRRFGVWYSSSTCCTWIIFVWVVLNLTSLFYSSTSRYCCIIYFEVYIMKRWIQQQRSQTIHIHSSSTAIYIHMMYIYTSRAATRSVPLQHTRAGYRRFNNNVLQR